MADVAATLAGWSSTTNSNSPSGSTITGSGVDDNFREIQGVIVRGLSHKGADISSATTTDIGAVEGLMHDITGTTTITGLGTVRAGILKILKFEGALTFTHNATSLILLGGANRTTADGDIGIYISEGSGNWREVAFFKKGVGATLMDLADPGADRILFWDESANKYEHLTASTGLTISGTNITVDAASDTAAGRIEIAVQSEMETATDNTRCVTPGRVQFHPGVAKYWVVADAAGLQVAGHNLDGVTDTGTGILTVAYSTDFSTGNYASLGQGYGDDTTPLLVTRNVSGGVSSAGAEFRCFSGGALTDPTNWSIAIFGDQ